MVTDIRNWYNSQFSHADYENYVQSLDKLHPGALAFRVAETPVFVSKEFTRKMLDACERMVDVIAGYNFKVLTAHAIPANVKVPGENDHTHFIAFDFGVCENDNGELEPQLVEMQGFPSLFAFQVVQDEMARQHLAVPDGYSSYLNGFTKDTYLQLLKEIIIGNENPEQVILLEILPHEQKTKVDFYCTQKYLGIAVVDLMELIQEGNKLYYTKEGKKIQVKRIYNRIIFDDLQQQSEAIREKGKILLEELDVQWVPHPNWFYRISKFTLPFIQHPYVPETRFVSDLEQVPPDLENYVLKPLFSFAGQGVVIDVTQQDIDQVKEPHNWILQRKVRYADIIPTPGGEAAKAEIRIFYFWKEGEARPVATNNLARLSKGKMIGVRYNKDKDWVGGTLAYFEQ